MWRAYLSSDELAISRYPYRQRQSLTSDNIVVLSQLLVDVAGGKLSLHLMKPERKVSGQKGGSFKETS